MSPEFYTNQHDNIYTNERKEKVKVLTTVFCEYIDRDRETRELLYKEYKLAISFDPMLNTAEKLCALLQV